MTRIGIVAGEPSGDFLAAELVSTLKRRRPDIEVEGIGGEQLAGAGCRILADMEKLAVMGLIEVLGRIRALRALQAGMAAHFVRNPPDLFIGVDAPDFNLPLERALRRKGIKTIHYVCPSVWAWRAYRTRGLKRAADLVLSVLPFEEEFLARYNVPVKYVGHPLARRVAQAPGKDAARRRLGLRPQAETVALLPGSRMAELRQLAQPFIETAAWLRARRPDIQFISNAPHERARGFMLEQLARNKDCPLQVSVGRMDETLAAADVALLASGTVALEAALHDTPMVVAYKMRRLSFLLLRALVRVDFVALPNLLAQRELAPEFLQDACCAPRLGPAVARWLDNAAETASFRAACSELRRALTPDDKRNAAAAVLAELPPASRAE